MVRAQHLLPYVRTLINQARRSALDDVFAVTESPGLSEVYDSAYHVPTEVTAKLKGLVDRLAGGSIGLAGPRGSGKSTLVRGYCDGAGFGSSDLRCMVAAPVDHVTRDFALRLFATFCRSVRAQLGRWSGPFRRSAVRDVDRHPVRRDVEHPMLGRRHRTPVPGPDRGIVTPAGELRGIADRLDRSPHLVVYGAWTV